MDKSKKIIFWILRIVGIGLMIFGVIKLVSSASADVPSMWDDNWFDAESERSFGIFSGIAMIMIGFFILVSSFIPSFKKMGQKVIQIANDDITTTVNTEVQQQQINTQKKCAYCGSDLGKGQVKCPSCGASRTTDK